MNLEEIEDLMSDRDRSDLLNQTQVVSNLRALADEVPGLVKEVRRLNLQVGDAKKVLDEFTTDVRICQAISKDCSGPDSCKCLYCRARSLIFHMDSGTAEKRVQEPPKPYRMGDDVSDDAMMG